MVQVGKLTFFDLASLVGQIIGHPIAEALTRLGQPDLVEVAYNVCTVILS